MGLVRLPFIPTVDDKGDPSLRFVNPLELPLALSGGVESILGDGDSGDFAR